VSDNVEKRFEPDKHIYIFLNPVGNMSHEYSNTQAYCLSYRKRKLS